MTLQELNALPPDRAEAELMKCCGCARWARDVCAQRPFADADALFASSDAAWRRMGRAEWLEAFGHHPRIGGADALREKFAATRRWSQGEQSKVAEASERTIQALAQGNADYEKKFGHIFIVCASGKSAEEMLALLRARLANDPAQEIVVAAAEQGKITRLRLEKLLISAR